MILFTSPQARASKREPIVMALVAPNVLSIENAITMGTRQETGAWETYFVNHLYL
jgi:hypothetical protein